MRKNERKIARLAGLPPTIKLPEHEKLSPKENSFWNLIKDKTLLRRVSVLWVMWQVKRNYLTIFNYFKGLQQPLADIL